MEPKEASHLEKRTKGMYEVLYSTLPERVLHRGKLERSQNGDAGGATLEKVGGLVSLVKEI